MPHNVINLLPIVALGFLGSFGHCLGMCSPLTVAFSLSQQPRTQAKWRQQVYFHLLLNLGRILSYALVGAGIGALGSVLVAGGEIAGIGSGLRRAIAIISGLMLIWFGLVQVKPNLLPRLPLLHPAAKGSLHNRISAGIVKLSMSSRWWTPAVLGLMWGLMPCGFLYAAQIKAAETVNLWAGSATMLAFGVGTLPTMLGVGVSTSLFSSNQRSQLFRLGGWLTITIGVLTLLRTGDTMVDYTGHAALLCLMLALIARPISHLWNQPLRYRRVLGVGAFVLSIAHTFHMIEHLLHWNLEAVEFMLPVHQFSMITGTLALVLITPAALTSFDWMQRYLGKRWRQIHLLSVPALVLCGVHTVLIGSHYLGELQWTWEDKLRTALLGLVMLLVLLMRWRWIWCVLSLEKFYAPAIKNS